MSLSLHNIDEIKMRLLKCDTSTFRDVGNSYRHFIKHLHVEAFRHLRDLHVSFEHPVTVIAGTNKIGKTSILLLLACSHENFLKIDSTSPTPRLRQHVWRDVLSFTAHETIDADYVYSLEWRVGRDERAGQGKRLAGSAAWSGLGKKSSDATRMNAKIRQREVRLVDLERILPGRSFSNALYRKANTATAVPLSADINKAFAYVFDTDHVEIFEVGGHINKSCFLIRSNGRSYSSYNAASGEESVIYLLKDIVDSPADSLILIDEIEAGFHPSVQRRLADIVQVISWRDKKQFIVTTHSPTLLSSLPARSRRFVEKSSEGSRVISGISQQAARSKMDSVGHPLVQLYCEDELASFLIKMVLVEMARDHSQIQKLVNIVTSGPINEVRNDYERHRRNYQQLTSRIGYCAVFDGDHRDHPDYSTYHENPHEHVTFLYPYEAPERFLVRAYLSSSPNVELGAALEHGDQHVLFQKMRECGLAADVSDARSRCYASFVRSPAFQKHRDDLSAFIGGVLADFSARPD